MYSGASRGSQIRGRAGLGEPHSQFSVPSRPRKASRDDFGWVWNALGVIFDIFEIVSGRFFLAFDGIRSPQLASDSLVPSFWSRDSPGKLPGTILDGFGMLWD